MLNSNIIIKTLHLIPLWYCPLPQAWAHCKWEGCCHGMGMWFSLLFIYLEIVLHIIVKHSFWITTVRPEWREKNKKSRASLTTILINETLTDVWGFFGDKTPHHWGLSPEVPFISISSSFIRRALLPPCKWMISSFSLLWSICTYHPYL